MELTRMWRLCMFSRLKMLGLGCAGLFLAFYWISSAINLEIPQTKADVVAEPVQISVYYETLCPDSKRFITDQLWPTFQAVSDIINLELIPYGKAYEVKSGNIYVQNCQHGPDECYGNLIQTCAIKLLPGVNKSLSLIRCMESYFASQAMGHRCSKRLDIDYKKIHECVESKQGNLWQHEMAQKTLSLEPPLDFVPRITVNGTYTRENQNKALNNFLGLVCDTYKGSKPEACLE